MSPHLPPTAWPILHLFDFSQGPWTSHRAGVQGPVGLWPLLTPAPQSALRETHPHTLTHGTGQASTCVLCEHIHLHGPPWAQQQPQSPVPAGRSPGPALPAMRPLQTSRRVRDAPPATRGQVLPEEHPAAPLSSHPADSFHKQSAQAAAASGKNTVSQAPCQLVCTPHLPFFPQQEGAAQR